MSCGKQFLLPSSELAEGQFREAQIQHNNRPIWLIVTRQSGTIRAWFNVCPHQGRSLNYAPDKFMTDPNGQLMCAAHGAVFEPENGVCTKGPCLGAPLKAIEASEENGRIFGSITNNSQSVL